MTSTTCSATSRTKMQQLVFDINMTALHCIKCNI